MKDNNSGVFKTILTSFSAEFVKWLIAALLAILTLFSSQFTESIKFALNRADLRTKQYEELATNVSRYIFAAEINTEFLENGWTSEPTLSILVKDYNDSYVTLRGKEYVYLFWVQKYWGKNEAAQFESFMRSVRKFDLAFHPLNDEFYEVNIAKSKKEVDEKRAAEALETIKPAVEDMVSQGRQFLMTAANR
jgi:hypothetical protein